MRFFREHRFVLMFLLLLVFCSVMVIRQFNLRQSRHIESREALIVLHTGGYTNEARIIYNQLLNEVPKLSTKELVDDWQRTVIMVDPNTMQPENLIWNYHWVVRKQMEYRSVNAIQRARDLAERLRKRQ